MTRIYKIPCPKSATGIFYCTTEFEPEMSSPTQFVILADTKRLWNRLSKDDPGMIDHAYYKLYGATATEYIHGNSPEHPIRTCHFIFNPDVGKSQEPSTMRKFLVSTLSAGFCEAVNPRRNQLSLVSGQTEMLVVFHDLDLPYIPIVVSVDNMNDLIELHHAISSDIGITDVECILPVQPPRFVFSRLERER